MKRRITLSIALALGLVLLSLFSSASTAKAQQPQRFRIATGVVTPGADQTLSIRVVSTDRKGDGSIKVRFGWTQYMEAGCNGMPAVCRHTVASQGVTPVVMLGDDALSFDVQGNGNGVNVIVESNSRNVKVLGVVFDTSTKRVQGILGEMEWVTLD